MFVKVGNDTTLEVPDSIQDCNFAVWSKMVHYRFLMSELGHKFPEKLGLLWSFISTDKIKDAKIQTQNMERMYNEIHAFAESPEYNPCILAVACMVQETVIEEIEELKQSKPIRECLTDKLLTKTAKWLIDNGLTQKVANERLAFFFKRLNNDFERRLPEIIAESKRIQKRYSEFQKSKAKLMLERVASMNTLDISDKYSKLVKDQIEVFEPAKLIASSNDIEKGVLTVDVERDNAYKNNVIGVAKYMSIGIKEVEMMSVYEYLSVQEAIKKEVEAQKKQLEKIKK